MKSHSIACLVFIWVSHNAVADWKAPREALDQHLAQGEYNIYYTLSGGNAFPINAEPNERPGLAKEQINQLAAQIALADRFYHEYLGLMSPLAMPRYQDVRSLDVHLVKLEGKNGSTGDGIVNYHYQHFASPTPSITIAISNNWQPGHLTPNHEVFHAYQYAYSFFKNPWYLEGMARSMELAFKDKKVRTEALPSNQSQLEEILTRSYDADKFWNRLMYLCDPGCSGSSPVESGQDKDYEPKTRLCAKSLVRGILEQYQAIDKEAAKARGINPSDWPETEQRSEKNNPYLLRGLHHDIESQCQVHNSPELEIFSGLLQRY